VVSTFSGASRRPSLDAVAEYLVEAYLSELRSGELEAVEIRARAAARDVAREGAPIQYLRSIFIPEDELCIYVFESANAAAVDEASRRAGIRFERIVESRKVNSPKGQKP
jgi:Nickel responsive protein SCO4226-like